MTATILSAQSEGRGYIAPELLNQRNFEGISSALTNYFSSAAAVLNDVPATILNVPSVAPYEPFPTNEVVPVMLVIVLHRDLVAISKFKIYIYIFLFMLTQSSVKKRHFN